MDAVSEDRLKMFVGKSDLYPIKQYQITPLLNHFYQKERKYFVIEVDQSYIQKILNYPMKSHKTKLFLQNNQSYL